MSCVAEGRRGEGEPTRTGGGRRLERRSECSEGGGCET